MMTLIKGYKITGSDFSELCKHNQLIAFKASNRDAVRLWEALPNMLSLGQLSNNENTVYKSAMKQEKHLKEQNIIMKFKEPNLNKEEVKCTVHTEMINKLVIRINKKQIIPQMNENLQAQSLKLKKLSDENCLKKKLQLAPEMRSFISSKNDQEVQTIDTIVLNRLKDQIQYLADNNDIVTAAVLSLILWNKIEDAHIKLLKFIIQYKGNNDNKCNRIVGIFEVRSKEDRVIKDSSYKIIKTDKQGNLRVKQVERNRHIIKMSTL